MSARNRLLDALRDHGCKVTNGGKASTCPAHEDKAPSLSIGDRTDGDGVVMRCHAGCDTEAVVESIGLSMGDLFDEPRQGRGRHEVARYLYTGADGTVLFEKVRYEPKDFRVVPPGMVGKLSSRPLYRLPDVLAAAQAGGTVYVVEGEKDADALVAAGYVATSNFEGAGKAWRPEYTQALKGADVVIVADRDETGHAHAATIRAALTRNEIPCRVVRAATGKDASDHLAAGHGVDELVPVDAEQVSRLTIEQAHERFSHWLGTGYDLDALDVVLAAAAVEQLDGDPVWLLLVSGSGNAKTETVAALAGAGAHVTSTITSEGALLSATSKRETTKEATGGLLRKIGGRGLLVVKDVTSILSMNSDTRAAVLAALREVYDGRWQRNVGTDGGRTLTWEGRLVLIGAVTTAYDRAHGVIASMGDRFALVRVDSGKGRVASGRQALANVGDEVQMRAELSDAAAGVLAGIDPARAVLHDDVKHQLLAAADIVTLARTAVEKDYKGGVEWAHAPEMPTRFAKMLGQIVRGALVLGLEEPHALRLALRVARDSLPPLRLLCLLDVLDHPHSRTSAVTTRVQRPRSTVDRTLQELHLLGLVEVDEDAEESGWHYSVPDEIDRVALQLLREPKTITGNTTTQALRHREGSAEEMPLPTGISGDAPPRRSVSPSGASGGPTSLGLAHLPGRCQACEHHVELQGHAGGCRAAVAS